MTPEQEQQNKEAQEIHGILQEMWEAMVEGGKKVIKKMAGMMDREGSQQPESENTY